MIRLLLLLLLTATSLRAQLEEVELSRISQQDGHPLAARALALHPAEWKHAEGEHFIYHYTRSHVANAVALEAEHGWRVIAQTLERDAPASPRKSHIYLFENPEDWVNFRVAGELEAWTGGIHSEGSLFLLRDAATRFADNTLAHEVAHLVLFRYYGHAIPLWLNEGFAQFVSKGAQASFHRARGRRAVPKSEAVDPTGYIPIAELLALTKAPGDRVDLFYDEAERLVRFLAAEKPRFLALLDALGRQETFDAAFPRVYAGVFNNRADFEEKFRAYASKDFAGNPQDTL